MDFIWLVMFVPSLGATPVPVLEVNAKHWESKTLCEAVVEIHSVKYPGQLFCKPKE